MIKQQVNDRATYTHLIKKQNTLGEIAQNVVSYEASLHRFIEQQNNYFDLSEKKCKQQEIREK